MAKVIVSTNDNPTYIQFWPLVATAWKKFGYDPVLVYVTDKSAEETAWTERYGKVVFAQPHPQVENHNFAPLSRILIAQAITNCQEKIMLSDIDMLPLSKPFFDNLILSCPDDKMLFSGSDAPGYSDRMAPICYYVAKNTVYREAINPQGLETYELLESWFNINNNFDPNEQVNGPVRFMDESLLRVLFNRWKDYETKTIHFKRGWPNDRALNRLDRLAWHIDPSKLLAGEYIDAHMPRPLGANAFQIYILSDYLGLDRKLIENGIKNI